MREDRYVNNLKIKAISALVPNDIYLVTKNENQIRLRKILNNVSSTAGALESIGRPISSSEDLFVFDIVELLDSRTRRE